MTSLGKAGVGRIMAYAGIVALLGLSGCSGGSNTAPPPPPPPPPVNAAPVFSSAGSASIAENVAGTVYQASATDADGDPITFSLSGADESRFSFNPSTGRLSFTGLPDFENPLDSNNDNNYELTFRANDGRGQITTLNVTISVTDEPPRDIVAFSGSTTLATHAADLDADGVLDILTVDRITGTVQSGADISIHDSDFTYIGFIGGFSLPNFDDGEFSDVRLLGDVDGDGASEIVVGRPLGANRSGEVFVLSGSDIVTPSGNLSVTPASSMFYFVDPDARDASMVNHAGSAIAALPDLDGDAIAEMLIGAPTTDLADSDAGEAFLVYSTEYANDADGAIDLGDIGGAFGLRMQGAGTSYLAGSAITSLGDVDGDNVADFAVGAEDLNAPALVRGGVVTVLFGDETFALSVTTFDLTNISAGEGVDIISMEPNRVIGKYVASAGDVDGDGLNDVLIGSPNADQGAVTDAGEVLLIYGATLAANAGGQIDLGALTPAQGVRILGADAQGLFGATLSSLGDVTNDGRDEFLVGAPTAYEVADPSLGSRPTGPGAVYVFDGASISAAASGVIDLAAVLPAEAVIIPGRNFEHGVGLLVDGLGDIDGDGKSELILGAFAQTPEPPTYYITGNRIGMAFENGDAEIALPTPMPRP